MINTINGEKDLPIIVTVHLTKDTISQITKNDFTKNEIMFINLKCSLSVDNEINTEEIVKMRLPFRGLKDLKNKPDNICPVFFLSFCEN